MAKSIIQEKTFVFSLSVIRIYQFLSKEKKEFVLSKQLLRSGTAIGALSRDATQAESKPDFIHKLSIALKEANETEYWLLLLRDSGILEIEKVTPPLSDIHELIKILTAIIKTTKANLKK